MPKRGKRRGRESHNDHVQHPSTRKPDESLEFEDDFGDVFEEEVVVLGDDDEQMTDTNSNKDTGSDSKANDAVMSDNVQTVYRPGVDTLEEGEELDYDRSAYTTYHKMNVEWPCLSFDILADTYGYARTKFPATFYMAAGTQANSPEENYVSLMRISDLHKTYEAPDDEEDDDDPEALDEDPILEERRFAHPGGVNRLRVCPNESHILATWSDQGEAHVWNVEEYLESFATPSPLLSRELKPTKTFAGHAAEGYAMAWSPHADAAYNLLTGDCKGGIYHWQPTDSGFEINEKPFVDHTDSVEDIQWSPQEPTVFATCSVDKTIRIWDTRCHKRSQLFVIAHDNDVNVISWNHKVEHLILSGSDDGSVKIWDLNNFKSDEPAAHFKWHTGPITSVEWHPTDESILAVASADNSISVWDMGLEPDQEVPSSGAVTTDDMEIPDQLLFVHQGQTNIKELHFHPQIPSLIISTAWDGFNIFKPQNMENLPDIDMTDANDDNKSK